MSVPRGCCRRARIAGRAGRPPARGRGPRHRRPGPPRRHRVAAAGRRGRPRARRAPGRARPRAWPCPRRRGQPLGAEVSSALFDQVRTCDNHCEFCFIYQLPPGLRQSLYVKDDDYRLSFLYGNFTTLTRFTELDLERVVTERLSPLNVSIHATDPEVRARMLRNRRGATSLRWLRALLDAGIEVHGQVVVCPGVNDGAVLDDTLAGVLDQYPELATVVRRAPGRQPLLHRGRDAAPHPGGGGGRRRHGRGLAVGVPRRPRPAGRLRRRRVLPAGRPPVPRGPTPTRASPMHEDGIGMARAFELELTGQVRRRRHRRAARLLRLGRRRPRRGLPGAPHEPARPATGARTRCRPRLRRRARRRPHRRVRRRGARPAPRRLDRPDVRVVPVENRFFGGNIGVTGLLVGEDLARALADQPEGHRYLLPDVACPTASSSTAPAPTTCPAGRDRRHRRRLPPPGPGRPR